MRLLQRLRDSPIRRKLRIISMASAGVALVLACGSFVAYDRITFRANTLRQLTTEAEIIARQSGAPLVFKDPDAARSTLEALRAESRIVSAAIYDQNGLPFASYLRGDAVAPPRPDPTGHRTHAYLDGRLVVFRPIEYDKGTIGTVVIESDLTAMASRLRLYAMIALGVLVIAGWAAAWTASRMERVITEPILHLASTAAIVSTRRDYSVRAVARGRDELGQFVDAFNQMLDQIEERDRALQTSRERYRQLFDANPNAMWVYEPSTLRFVAVNDAAVHAYGYSRKEFLGMSIKDIRPEEDVPLLLERIEGPDATAKRSDGLWRHRRKDGSLVDVEIASSTIDFGGTPARLVMAADVSEKKRLESQLLQAQKMEAIGRLAGGVAHDFNNLLGVITGYSDLLRKTLGSQESARRRVEQIQKAAERAAGLTRQLLAFSRKEVIQPRVIDLNATVADVEKMLRRLIGEDVQLVTKLGDCLGRIEADHGQVDQVIMNLAVNARDAMPQGGTLWIETSNAILDEAFLRTHADVLPGRYVLLAVTDTGQGMDAETLSHVFEPFFTTKEQGKGTGLGLSTVFGIVKRAGGLVSVYSEPGKGTTFRVYWPRVDADLEQRGDVVYVAPPRGSETVLLVEDAESLRPMILEILEAAGYNVLESADPQEAILRARDHEGRLDLVLTDVIMPHMSGPELVAAVRTLRPEIKALFMSGYTSDAIGRHGVIDAHVHFLQKPFNSDALLTSVRTALDSASPLSSHG